MYNNNKASFTYIFFNTYLLEYKKINIKNLSLFLIKRQKHLPAAMLVFLLVKASDPINQNPLAAPNWNLLSEDGSDNI